MMNKVWLIIKYMGFLGLIMACYQKTRIAFSKLLHIRYLKRRIYQYKMYLDVDDGGISKTLLLFGKREIDHKKLLEKIVKPGMTILDIGANIGYYVLMERELLRGSGKIVAVEPSPGNIDLFKKNMWLNQCDNVFIHHCALSDENGEREFYLSVQSNLNTFHNTGSGVQHLSGEVIKVKTMKVQEVMAPYGSPDLIRMDVEGHEVEIMQGLLPDIRARSMAPIIIFETHLSRYSADHDIRVPLNALFDCGYCVRYMSSSSDRGTKVIRSRGYLDGIAFKSDFMRRVIFEDISRADALEIIALSGGARTVVLMPPEDIVLNSYK